MSGHTDGGLTFIRANGEANNYALIDDVGRWWMVVLMNGEQTTERQEANLRRLAACWNACVGIDTMLLEPRMLGNQIIAARESVEQRNRLNGECAALNDYCATIEHQRDKLLEALQVLKRDVEALAPGLEIQPALFQAAMAIDAATGQAAP